MRAARRGSERGRVVMAEDIRWLVTALMSAVAVIGGLLMRDRHVLALIRKGDEANAKATQDASGQLHERVNRIRDEYVRRDDHDRAYDALKELITSMREEQRYTNQRLDQVLARLPPAKDG